MKHNKWFATKKKHVVIKLLVAMVLFVIVVNQIIWLSNMYDLFEREFIAYVNETIEKTAYMELTERGEELGGFSVYGANLNLPSDSSRYFQKKVVTADSTYTFIIDKNDPNTMHKISQFVLKRYLPIRLDRLSELFKENIHERYDVDEVYFKYLDLDNDTIISTDKPRNISMSHFIITDTIPMDIVKSIGLVGFVEAPRMLILDRMKIQLILSVLLICVALVSLFYISKSFLFQWKTERMRQDSVNAMTHEFKRPISAAVAMAATIPYYLEKNDIKRVNDYVINIQTSLNKLTSYTKRIQQISNNDRGQVILDITEVEIIPFFNTLQQRYEIAGQQEENVNIKMDFHTSRKTMKVDAIHFSNVIDNLVENAIKYTVEDVVKIVITLSDVTEGLMISVKDNGVGISSVDRKYIFDKFYRVSRAETKHKAGFGLGLTYVKSIIEAHGGSITVNSELHEGSEFIIFLQC